MKVVAISGSPRIGGNSDVLCDQFLKGAQESGHEAVKINLSKKKLSPCSACYSCNNTGVCVKKDDMEKILEEVILSDVIVLATPVYFYSMDSQMKMFIDRCLPRYREIKDKSFYFIITAADPDHEAMRPTIEGLRGYTVCLNGAKEKDIIYGTGAWEKGDILGMPAMKKAYEAGKNL